MAYYLDCYNYSPQHNVNAQKKTYYNEPSVRTVILALSREGKTSPHPPTLYKAFTTGLFFCLFVLLG